MRKNQSHRILVIGGGLAGVEAAYYLASHGINVDLFEMRPSVTTPAHTTPYLTELVCSNSFKGDDPTTAHGLLKKEMRLLHSLMLKTADRTKVPAGKALAVDRNAFAQEITKEIESQPLIRIIREEVQEIDPNIPTIIATGPLTSDLLAQSLQNFTSGNNLFFYDAIAPIIDTESIDMDKAFLGSRWDKESTDYLNCPMTKQEYYAFVDALLAADEVEPHEFEGKNFFEACLPIEVIAKRGANSLAFGPMRPVGFIDPKTGERPFALVQLRKENLKGNAYNMVGFQTRLTYPAQEKVFRMIPGLESVKFLRLGSIHRNTFIDSPRVLNNDLSLIGYPNIKLAGQITGVEGYMESAAMGIVAGIAMYAYLHEKTFSPPSPSTAIGALINYITDPTLKKFQPMNINFGIMESPNAPKHLRRETLLKKQEIAFKQWLDSFTSNS